MGTNSPPSNAIVGVVTEVRRGEGCPGIPVIYRNDCGNICAGEKGER